MDYILIKKHIIKLSDISHVTICLSDLIIQLNNGIEISIRFYGDEKHETVDDAFKRVWRTLEQYKK
jgi:hypothetical protein